MKQQKEVWITGIGIVSCLGEGPDAHWQALGAGNPQADAATYPPYIIHKLAPLDCKTEIVVALSAPDPAAERAVAGAAPRIELRNAKDEAVTVRVQESLPGDWEMLSQSHLHKKESSHLASWSIAVPAEGKTTLDYKIKVRW